jgi:hypothetical protein
MTMEDLTVKLSSDSQGKNQIRVYRRSESVVFLKTTEAFGGLSNMAGGFPLRVSFLLECLGYISGHRRRSIRRADFLT